MKFGYTIIYVNHVPETLAFYKAAFDFDTRFLHESGEYGELETGATTLAFASHNLGQMNLDGKYQKSDLTQQPLGVEIAFVTHDVKTAFDKALKAGASAIAEPKLKPWGQTVAYVRAIEGSLIELCSPVSP